VPPEVGAQTETACPCVSGAEKSDSALTVLDLICVYVLSLYLSYCSPTCTMHRKWFW